MRYFVLLILTLFLSGRNMEKLPERRLFVPPAFAHDSLLRTAEWINFRDTVAGDTLAVYRIPQGILQGYSRDISTGVCIDGECRRLRITLFWTATGRYWGFVLPEGEFLSKTEHVPFKEEDYRRLHEILANPNSVLQQYRMDELITGKKEEVDGISAATLAAVKQEVVPDAVYTTYTLWHLIYGETQKEIRNYTCSRLSDQLAAELLKSPDFEDKYWTLENMGPKLQWSSPFRDQMAGLILNDQGILAVQALAAVPDSLLGREDFQNRLISGFSQIAYLNRRKLLERLGKGIRIHTGAAHALAAQMPQMNAELVGLTLKLFEKQSISDEQTAGLIASLLDHDNPFIVRKALDYLQSKEITDKELLRKIRKAR